MPYITGSLPLQEGSNLLHLAASRRGIVQEVAEFTRIRLHIHGAFDGPGIAFQDKHLMLRSQLLSDGMHW